MPEIESRQPGRVAAGGDLALTGDLGTVQPGRKWGMGEKDSTKYALFTTSY